jgi:hypothetical protein
MQNKIINMQGRTHGIGGYNFGCRCDVCKEAKAIKRKEYQSSDAWQKRKEYLQRMRDERPEMYAEWLKRNGEYKKRSYSANPEKARWETIYKKYKLTKALYLDILDQQNGVCAICKLPPNRNWLAVDHNHLCCPGIKTCGQCVRGLLCASCNSFLGRVNDSLDNAQAYLDAHNQVGDANA